MFGNLALTIAVSYHFLVLAHLVMYGIWLAALVYQGGHSNAWIFSFVRHVYRFAFGCSIDARFLVPSLNFDLRDIPHAIEQFLAALRLGLMVP